MNIYPRSMAFLFWISAILLFLYTPLLHKLWYQTPSLSIMTWADLLDEDLIKRFEEETGIKINLSYFESNEELYARFRATGGRGHDLILPSDFTVQTLIQDGLLKPIDTSKLLFWNRLDKRLLNLYYDPQNQYSVPFFWSIYGIGYNNTLFHNPEASWKLVFDISSLHTLVVVPETAREVMLLAAYYLYRSTELNLEKINEIKNLLLEQKKHVGAYSETRADYLLMVKEIPLAVIPSANIWRTIQQYPYLDFLVPQEGTFTLIDNFVIPKYSKHEEWVYQFLNFIYRPENIRTTFEKHRFFPATNELIPLLQEYGAADSVIEAHAAPITTRVFFKNTPYKKFMDDAWVALKSY